MMIVDYTILERDEFFKLKDTVKTWIQDGWQPLGGVSIALVTRILDGVGETHQVVERLYAQAMVKYA